MADTYNYRIDHHGSLVRPATLLAAREQYARSELDDGALHTAELTAVTEAVAQQRRLRSTVVTDGDLPRADFRSAVLEGVTGFRRTREAGPDGLPRWVAESLPKADGPLVADWAAEVAGMTAVAAKVSLPSPAYLAATCFAPELAISGGPSAARELGEALAEIVHTEIALLVSRGVRLIQLDDPLLLAATAQDAPATVGALSLDDALAVDALAVRLDSRPEGVRVAVCPGTEAPATVDPARAERLFTDVPGDRWVLPYARGTSAELDLLRALPEDRDVCLGVVDPVEPEGGSTGSAVDTIMPRIDAAAEIKDIEDMALAPTRGFAPTATRPLTDAETQRQVLVLVETLARYCWGNEF